MLTDGKRVNVLDIPVGGSRSRDTVDIRLVEREDGVPALLSCTSLKLRDRRRITIHAALHANPVHVTVHNMRISLVMSQDMYLRSDGWAPGLPVVDPKKQPKTHFIIDKS